MRTNHSQARTNNLRGVRYNAEDLDRLRKAKDVDALGKGQNAKAAQLLMEEYYKQESARNMPEVITAYGKLKAGHYGVDVTNSGRVGTTSMPPDWPFSEAEWEGATTNGPHSMLCRAMAYTMHERERLMRQHEQLFNHGVDAFDPVQVERQDKSRAKAGRFARRNWRERMRDKFADAIEGESLIGGYASAAGSGTFTFSPDAFPDATDIVVEISP